MKMNDVQIKVTVNGQSVPLSTISTETFEKIKSNEGKDKYEIYCEENPVYADHAATIIDDPVRTDCRLVRVPLPNANTDWTFAAFNWVKNFVAWSEDHVYPVHGAYAPDNKTIYIRIPKKGD